MRKLLNQQQNVMACLSKAWSVLGLPALAVLMVIVLSGCGFKPRTDVQQYAFKTVAADIRRSMPTALLLRQRMQAGGNVRFFPRTVVRGEKQKTDVILEILRDQKTSIVRGENVDAEVRELTLVQRFNFRLRSADGTILLPEVRLQAERDTTYTENTGAYGRDLLYRDMQNDLAQQATYRLATVKLP